MGYNKNNSSDFIVYVARYDGEVMYVGEGKDGRQNHITSGTSHLYEANRYHFSGMEVSVDIVGRYSTKEEARFMEKSMIQTCKPIWNKIDTTFDAIRARKEYRATLHDIVRSRDLTNKGQIECMEYIISKVWRDGRCSLEYDELSKNTSCSTSRTILSPLVEGSMSEYRPKKLGKLLKVKRLSKREFIVELTEYFKDYGKPSCTSDEYDL